MRSLDPRIQQAQPENGAEQADAETNPHRDPLPPLSGAGLYAWLRRAAMLMIIAAVTLVAVVMNVSRNGRPAAPRQTSGEHPGAPQPAQVSDADAAAIEQREKQLIADLLEGGRMGSEPVSPLKSGASSNIDAVPEAFTTGEIAWPAAAPAPPSPDAALPAASLPPVYVYASTRLSIVHENGVAGIPEGSRLALIERRGENLLISYKGYQGEVPAVDTRDKP